jgi:tRNA A-37 threonylcarbamoyl transferase component Bud32
MTDSFQSQIEEHLRSNPQHEVQSIKRDGKKFWIKRARNTGSNLLHHIAYKITKNPILIPAEYKSAHEALQFESSKLKKLHELSIPVPRVVLVTEDYFVIEDCGPTVNTLLRNNSVSNPNELIQKALDALAALHNQNEYHGGSQIKNLTYQNETVFFIDFEESFPPEAKLDELQFRDLFLFLISISRAKIEINYQSFILKYIELTRKHDTIERFHVLIGKVTFLMKLLEYKFIWSIVDRDTKSVYQLLKQIQNIPPHINLEGK